MDSLFFSPSMLSPFAPASAWDAPALSTLDTCDWSSIIAAPVAPMYALDAPVSVAVPVPVPGHVSPPSSPDVAESTTFDAAESSYAFSAAEVEAFRLVADQYSSATRAEPHRATGKRIPKTKIVKAESASNSDDDQPSTRNSRTVRGNSCSSNNSSGAGKSFAGKTKAANMSEEERVVLRRLKNREASQLSRDRKRQRLEVLEAEVAHQKTIVHAVERERDDALRVAAMLRAELAHIKAAFSRV
eukprot:c32298_g1_i1.p3 GENE.c32298_g1_i1~~c32298_g1_i1.p3  ORF type:complete len:244 (+),score=40.60 c32298_g1_i1:213-944(+)